MNDTEHVYRKLFKLEARIQKLQTENNKKLKATQLAATISREQRIELAGQYRVACATIARLQREAAE